MVDLTRRCPTCGKRADQCFAHGDDWKKAPPEDPTLDARRSWQGYYDAGLPWTGEFEDAVNRGEVDVS